MRYCPYFCEENIWHLCQDPSVRDEDRVIPLEDRLAVFISNDGWAVPMDHQRAGQGSVVVWDYHVVLFAQMRSGWHVWDLDCERGAPLPVWDWMTESFLVDKSLEAYRALTKRDVENPRFRIVDAADFVEQFSSDRSHMIDPRGRWSQPFPDWPAILDAEGTMNLMQFADTRSAFVGHVLSYDELRLWFCSK